ncbi:recombinase family protein [Sphingomonas ginkgonis]|uniref:recombinase family protein n=1 Tax=Sphingomonas ginkgonis TaxID=2315330 RepID=UPI001C8C6D4D|nr:recombinase family protein [Sphingomonas ginkgonis]
MGGAVPLGYDVVGRQLVVNAAEAEQVRKLFQLYAKLKAVDDLVAKAAELGIRSKLRSVGGKQEGGIPLSRGSLYRILANPVYVGEIPHKEIRHKGQHDGIVEPALFNAVQEILESNRRKKRGAVSAAVPAPLAGLVWSEEGQRLTSTHTSGRRRYRYYAHSKLRIPAGELEQLVIDALRDRFSSLGKLATLLPRLDLLSAELGNKAATLAQQLFKPTPQQLRQAMLDLVQRVTVGSASTIIDIKLAPLGLGGQAELIVPAALGRSRAKLSLVVPGQFKAEPDAALIGIVAQARSWVDALTSGAAPTLVALAEAHAVTPAYIRRYLGAGFLAPDLVCRIVEGRQPRALTAAKLADLLPLPSSWSEQRSIFAKLN